MPDINCRILRGVIINKVTTIIHFFRTIHNILEKWFPLPGERAQSLKVYNKRMSVFKNNIKKMRKRR